MSIELRWAVTDGPAGTAAVALPEDGKAARVLGLRPGSDFWCSREAGGCGGRPGLEARGDAPPPPPAAREHQRPLRRSRPSTRAAVPSSGSVTAGVPAGPSVTAHRSSIATPRR